MRTADITETRFIDVNDATLEVAIAGPLEPPLLCTAHPADPFGEPAAASLRERTGATVVCVNPRGVGRSSPPAPDRPQRLAEIADDLEAVRQRLGVEPWIFWGMSGGGWLGQRLALRHAASLSGLIIESACGCFRERVADPACILCPRHPAWRERLEAEGLLVPDEAGTADTEWIDVADVGAVLRRRGGPALLVSPVPLAPLMRRRMALFLGVDHRAWLHGLTARTLVLCGDGDPLLPVAHARALAAAIPGAELVVSDGGHVPTSEGREIALAAVRRFVAGRRP